MKTIGISLVLTILTSLSVFAQSVKIDLEHSTLKWEGKKVTGKHWGYVKFEDGNVTIKNDMFTGGMFVVNMTSMNCVDIEDEKWNKKLVDHLHSNDFFATKEYKTSKLVITKVVPLGNMKYKFYVDLTIKGITKVQEFDAVVTKEGELLKTSGTIVIDRTSYNIKYGSGSFFDNLGDRTISDDFTIEFVINATIPE